MLSKKLVLDIEWCCKYKGIREVRLSKSNDENKEIYQKIKDVFEAENFEII